PFKLLFQNERSIIVRLILERSFQLNY
ncbi:MAG: hypothetical protein ACI9XO_004635, partial [Paraglaciecola sp.]